MRLQTATLGEFEIFTELGRGGMAAVYLARDLALNRRVAIKVMAPGLMVGPGMIDRFRQEAVTVANLQHAHIVSIYAVRQLADLHFFVMQFVPGRTLEGVLRDVGALPIPVVRAWLYQIGSALGHAHRRGVIHRDIKPGNILLNVDGEAIVTDFGIAKVAESPSQTQTGTVVGTPIYMSPEQCYARELTGASDQYSLGIVAYEMLAGRPPFSGSSFSLMRAHTDEAPPPLATVRADIPPTMAAAIMRMLAKTPADRFATLADALAALGAEPLAPGDPLHETLQRLAAVTERMEQLGDVIRTPASPVPQTRERRKAAANSAATPTPQPVSAPAVALGATPVPAAVGMPSAVPSMPSTATPATSAGNDAGPGPKRKRAIVWGGALAVTVLALAYGTLRRDGVRSIQPSPVNPVALRGADSTPAPRPNVGEPANSERLRDDSVSAPTTDPTSTATVPPTTAPITLAPQPAQPGTGAEALVARRIEIRPAKPDAISPGRSVALAAVVLNASGRIVNATTIAWASSDTRVATVDPASGIVRGIRPGATRITARSASLVAGVVVTVAPSASDSIATSTADASHARPAGRSDASGPTSPNVTAPPTSSSTPTPKSEAQLRSEIQAVLASYAHAIEMRDTSLIRRVFPDAGYELMTRWQTTFNDARGPIAMNDAALDIVDAPRDVPGSQVHVRAKYAARFSSRAARSDQSFPVTFTAVLLRDGGAWRIASIR
jgi:serine/threonine-protein kinase